MLHFLRQQFIRCAAQYLRGDKSRGVVRAPASLEQAVLHNLATLTAVLAVAFLGLSQTDPWFVQSWVDSKITWGGAQPDWDRNIPHISARNVGYITLGLACVLALLHGLIVFRRPKPKWAHFLAFVVITIFWIRGVSYLLAAPNVFHIEKLALSFMLASCVFLSIWWHVAYIGLATTLWFWIATRVNSSAPWALALSTLISSSILSIAILELRRRSVQRFIRSNRRDEIIQKEVLDRARLSDAALRISGRFLVFNGSASESALSIESVLREIGKTLGADYVVFCRMGRTARVPTSVHQWWETKHSFIAGLTSEIPLAVYESDELTKSRTMAFDQLTSSHADHTSSHLFGRLKARSFASIPLANDNKAYLGVANFNDGRIWLDRELQFINGVGDNLLQALERHETEITLRRGEARFRQLFESNLFTVFFANIFGSITDANDAFFELTGFSRNALPLRWDSLIPPEMEIQFDTSITRLVTHGIDYPKEIEFLDKDKERIPVLVGSTLLIRDRGEFLTFVVDLREQREAEKTIEKLRDELNLASRLGMMGEMVAGLAHEVHQPLAAISNYANGAKLRLERGQLAPEALDEIFREIASLCEQAGGVTANIKRFIQGRHPIRGPVDINVTVEQAVRLLRFELQNRSIVLSVRLDRRIPNGLTDTTELTQILLNLMMNASQAMDGQESLRELIVETEQLTEREIGIRVTDSGPGIPLNFQHSIFDQFFTTKQQGLGMGLSLSRTMAEAAGGGLDLVRSDASGTTFLVRVPVIGNDDHGQPNPFGT